MSLTRSDLEAKYVGINEHGYVGGVYCKWVHY